MVVSLSKLPCCCTDACDDSSKKSSRYSAWPLEGHVMQTSRTTPTGPGTGCTVRSSVMARYAVQAFNYNDYIRESYNTIV